MNPKKSRQRTNQTRPRQSSSRGQIAKYQAPQIGPDVRVRGDKDSDGNRIKKTQRHQKDKDDTGRHKIGRSRFDSSLTRPLDESKIEQRALQIARDEGRNVIVKDDRARAREELFAPNEPTGNAEIATELVGSGTATWEEAPVSRGHQTPKIGTDEETNISKELVEKGLRSPRRNRNPVNPGRYSPHKNLMK